MSSKTSQNHVVYETFSLRDEDTSMTLSVLTINPCFFNGGVLKTWTFELNVDVMEVEASPSL